VFKSVRNRWVQHPSIDIGLASVVVLIHVAVVERSGHYDPLMATGFENRLSLYTDMITVTGIFVGFTGAALASYLAIGGERMDDLRHRAGTRITKQWFAAITAPSAAIAIFIIAKVFDGTHGDATNVRWLAEAAFLLVAIRLCRMLYVFASIINIAMRPDFRRSSRTRPIGVRNAS